MDRGLDGFDPIVLSKAKRLAVVLDELGQDDAISERLALHGGTAINTFLLDMPRLSVDIDLSVISDAEPEQVPALREEVLDHIARDLKGLGYRTNYGKG